MQCRFLNNSFHRQSAYVRSSVLESFGFTCRILQTMLRSQQAWPLLCTRRCLHYRFVRFTRVDALCCSLDMADTVVAGQYAKYQGVTHFVLFHPLKKVYKNFAYVLPKASISGANPLVNHRAGPCPGPSLSTCCEDLSWANQRKQNKF